ncbi:class IIb bacteriocin, lactobin A/cerein 7B family [Paenibacillus xanthanilyticus]|uniref:Class IIb bacteriocin, lactobin A/cerein 7B family n=1 Tax=Paenibacillus xanthanilyticus TaxID=1783531 RepID=A0ABV8K2N1_9BACL
MAEEQKNVDEQAPTEIELDDIQEELTQQDLQEVNGGWGPNVRIKRRGR